MCSPQEQWIIWPHFSWSRRCCMALTLYNAHGTECTGPGLVQQNCHFIFFNHMITIHSFRFAHMDTFHDNVSLFWSLTLAWNDKEESILNMQLLQTRNKKLLIFTWGKLYRVSWCNLCLVTSCLIQIGEYPPPTKIGTRDADFKISLNPTCKSILFLPTNMIKMKTPQAILKIPRIFETVRKAQFLKYKIWRKLSS